MIACSSCPPPLRVKWVDSVKGIAILLTIVGHTVSYNLYGSSLRGLIFSFHMPLFFILSCYTYKPSASVEQFKGKAKHAFQHLIGPAIFVYGLNTLITCVRTQPDILSLHYWKNLVYTFLFASGVSLTFNGFDVAQMGIPWFFFALFIGRSVFDYLHLAFPAIQLPAIVALIGFSGIFFGKFQWLPFSMDIALAAMPFFYFGFCMKKSNLQEKASSKFLIWGLVWLVTLFLAFPHYEEWTYLELAVRRYNFFPISYLTAIAGTMCLSEFCIILEQHFDIILKPFTYLGRNSLYVLCVHILDGQWSNLWNVAGHQFHSSLRRVIIDCILSVLVISIIAVYKRAKKPSEPLHS